MAGAVDFDDEYVTQALKTDAEKASTKYSSLGLSAYLPKRPTTSAPKPNTRFLQHLIRDTDSHNAALLAKEKREARERERERQRNARGKEEGRLSLQPDDEIDRPRKRRRSHEREERRSDRHRRRHDSEEKDSRHKRGHERYRERDRRRSRSPRRRVRSDEENDSKGRRQRSTSSDSSGSEGRHTKQHRRDRDRRSFGRAEEKDHKRTKRSSRDARSRSRSPNKRRRDLFSDPAIGTICAAQKHVSSKQRFPTPASDSDPLEAIVGPPPPPREPKVRSRGRGVLAGNKAAMDEHFASSYNPSVDVQLDQEEEDDWDQALEALRDRQRWKQQGADRLKAAGFSEEQVKKWEKGDSKDEIDVEWAKKGEKREWDRGKIVGEDGVELEPQWGRLKGT